MAKREALIDLKRTTDAEDGTGSTLASPAKEPKSRDSYPYGTELHLDHETMDKLGMDTPRVGDKHHVHAHAHVTSVSEDHRDGEKKTRRVTLQLRKMSVSPHIPKSSGRAGGKYADAAMGAKSAMDAALATSDDE